jgi:hypothetical protein
MVLGASVCRVSLISDMLSLFLYGTRLFFGASFVSMTIGVIASRNCIYHRMYKTLEQRHPVSQQPSGL